MSVKGPIFILAIDGGGSRGAIPARAVAKRDRAPAPAEAAEPRLIRRDVPSAQ